MSTKTALSATLAKSTAKCSSSIAKSPRHQAAFTLLELIVVIFIVGLMAGFATLSLNQQSDVRLQTEAQRLHHLIQLASDEAITQSREYALQIGKEGYSFLMLDKEGKFTPLKDDAIFHPREFDPDFKIHLELNGEAVEFNPEQAPPQIYILSSGEIAPNFKLLLNDVDGLLGQYQIAIGEDGRSQLTTLSGATS